MKIMGVGHFDSEADALTTLRAEGRKLERIARKVWQEYEGSYSPNKYVRTGKSKKAIKLKTMPIKIDNNHIAIEVTWENSLSWHDSVVPKSSKKGHSILLISAGWHSKKLEKIYGGAVYRHTYYEGFGYLTKVMQQYNAVKDPRIGFELEVLVKMKRPLK